MCSSDLFKINKRSSKSFFSFLPSTDRIINDAPTSNDAWVGIYPESAPDNEHGEEGDRWNWLNKIDPNNATFPEKSEGRWSIRVFSDGGFSLDSRLDFDITPKKEIWWKD